jgi:phosphotransferase system HPr (HPr) family protein
VECGSGKILVGKRKEEGIIMIEKIYVLENEEGLHARPATILANESMKFNCNLKMLKNDNKDKVYQPKSILSVMSMGAAKGDQITIITEGEDEKEASAVIGSLFECGFKE